MATLVHALYALGLMVFAVVPHAAAGWGRTLLLAVLFGGIAYSSYDLSNLDTLKGWPVALSFIDVAWGGAVSAASAATGKAVMDRFTRA